MWAKEAVYPMQKLLQMQAGYIPATNSQRTSPINTDVPKFRWGDPQRRTWARSPGVVRLYEGLYWTCGQFPVCIQSRPQYFASSILLINFFGFPLGSVGYYVAFLYFFFYVLFDFISVIFWFKSVNIAIIFLIFKVVYIANVSNFLLWIVFAIFSLINDVFMVQIY